MTPGTSTSSRILTANGPHMTLLFVQCVKKVPLTLTRPSSGSSIHADEKAGRAEWRILTALCQSDKKNQRGRMVSLNRTIRDHREVCQKMVSLPARSSDGTHPLEIAVNRPHRKLERFRCLELLVHLVKRHVRPNIVLAADRSTRHTDTHRHHAPALNRHLRPHLCPAVHISVCLLCPAVCLQCRVLSCLSLFVSLSCVSSSVSFTVSVSLPLLLSLLLSPSFVSPLLFSLLSLFSPAPSGFSSKFSST